MNDFQNSSASFVECKLIEKGVLQRIGGSYTYTSKGKKLKNDIENHFRNILDSKNCREVELPVIIDYTQVEMDPIIKRGRLAQCYEIETVEEKIYHLAHTSEELAATYLSSKTDETIYQIRSKFRNESKVDLYRRLEFTMLELYSYSQDVRVYQAIRTILLNALEGWVKHIRIKKVDGDDIGIISEEILYEVDENENIEIGHFYMMGDTYKKTLRKEGFFSSYGIGIDRLLICSILSQKK